MSDPDALQTRIENPAPRGGEASTVRLFVGLAAPPAAWVLQLLILYGWASDSCMLTQGEHGQARQSGFAGEGLALLAVNLVFLAVAVGAGCLSWRDWTRVGAGDEQPQASIGEGRERFLALSGLLSAGIFATGILFGAVEPLMVPVCWRWR